MKKPVVYAGIVALFVIGFGLILYMIVGAHVPRVSPSNTSTNATGTMANTTLNWEITGNDAISSIFLGNDGTLYAFMGDKGNDIHAMNPDGRVKWGLAIPDKWRVLNPLSRPINGVSPGYLDYYGPVLSSENGTLYLYIREDNDTRQNPNYSEGMSLASLFDMSRPGRDDPYVEERLLAISPEGKVAWNRSIGTGHPTFEDINLIAKNSRIYAFDNYTETVFDESGSELFKIPDISSPASVDENGFLYVVPGQPRSLPSDLENGGVYREPASIVEAYYPNGTRYWQKDIEEPILRIELGAHSASTLDTLPLHQNRTLYVPVNNGIFAISVNGSVKWSKHFDDAYNGSYGYFKEALPYWYLPVDDGDNFYMLVTYQFKEEFHAISPDGQDKISDVMSYGGDTYADPKDRMQYDAQFFTPYNTGYEGTNGTICTNTTLDDLLYSNITAYNVSECKLRWTYTIVPNKTVTTITGDNAKKILSVDISPNTTIIGSSVYQQSSADILPGKGVVYVNYRTTCYEWPIVVNKSRCSYSSKIIALDKTNGTLLWEKSLDTFVTSMAVNNSTIYYGTRGGQLAGGGVAGIVGGVAGGVTVTAIAYVLFKFIGVGAVARAKDRLGKNGNRSKVLEFIAGRPGSTLHEIAHGLGMNVGTVRYHLFILGVNHRIVSSKHDAKFIRYFTNSGSYSKEEQFILSLARRDGIGKVMGLLSVRPGLSNVELSSELNMQESAVSRHLRELSSKGVVERKRMPDGRPAYSISTKYKAHVAFAIGHIDGQ